MSNKLNFANVSEAYNIASEQIKSRQDQIDKLKKIINENSNINKVQNSPNTISQLPVEPVSNIEPVSNVQPVQPVHPVQQVQQVQKNNNSEDFEYSFYKLASNPKFDQAVQNYIILKQPEWLNRMNTPQMDQMNKSNFGNNNNDDIKHYILFFVFSVIIYLILGILVKT